MVKLNKQYMIVAGVLTGVGVMLLTVLALFGSLVKEAGNVTQEKMDYADKILRANYMLSAGVSATSARKAVKPKEVPAVLEDLSRLGKEYRIDFTSLKTAASPFSGKDQDLAPADPGNHDKQYYKVRAITTFKDLTRFLARAGHAHSRTFIGLASLKLRPDEDNIGKVKVEMVFTLYVTREP